MTAEIAILNRSAVTLAADSAMTFGPPGAEKIYPVNKLFTLSKFYPVGIMIYNNADHMGVPFETIIKMYRDEKWNVSEITINQYAQDFIQYLLSPLFCTDEQVSHNVKRIFKSVFSTIKVDAQRDIQKEFEKTRKVPRQKISRFININIKKEIDRLESYEDNGSLNKIQGRTIVSKYNTEFDAAVKDVLEISLPITKQNRQALRVLARLAILKDDFTDEHTGLVIAGFGEEEMFPSLIEILVDGAVDSALKYKVNCVVDIGRQKESASIQAFAQSEMVTRFMDGVDPDFELYIKTYVKQIMSNLAKEIVNSHVSGSTSNKKIILKGVSATINDFMDNLSDHSDNIKNDFAMPIINAVKSMPKSELAHMAEALVNLTSIKRRVSAEKETVGGPVDVVVISKGDGFVWIKRKHYFDIEMNKYFMMRYFEREKKS